MADRVDTAVHSMQPSRGRAVAYGPVAEPQRAQLLERHHAVLPLRQRRDLRIQWGLLSFRTLFGRILHSPLRVRDRGLQRWAFCDESVTGR